MERMTSCFAEGKKGPGTTMASARNAAGRAEEAPRRKRTHRRTCLVEKAGKYDYSVGVGTKGPQAWCHLAAHSSVGVGAAPDFKVVSHVCMEDNASNPLRLPVRQAAALASAVADRDGRARLERQSSTRPCPRRMNELRARHGVPSGQRMEHSVSNGVEFHAKPSRRLAKHVALLVLRQTRHRS